jgi:ketosteroid isomerase-like protein
MPQGNVDVVRSVFEDAFDVWRAEDERFLELGGGKQLLLCRIVGRDKAGGAPIDRPVGLVYTEQDGELYLDQQDALKAGFAHSFGLFGADDLDAAVANLDPDIEWVHQPGTGAPEEGVYQGRDKVRSLLGRLREAWDHFSVDVHDVSDRGSEFIVDGTIHARGRISDIELEGECEYVIEYRESQAVRIRFTTRTAPVLSTREQSDVS